MLISDRKVRIQFYFGQNPQDFGSAHVVTRLVRSNDYQHGRHQPPKHSIGQPALRLERIIRNLEVDEQRPSVFSRAHAVCMHPGFYVIELHAYKYAVQSSARKQDTGHHDNMYQNYLLFYRCLWSRSKFVTPLFLFACEPFA